MPESTDFLARAELKISPRLQFADYPNYSPLRSQSTAALYQCESDDESGVMKSSCSRVSTNLFVLWMFKQLNSPATNNLCCFSLSTNN